MHYFDAFKYDSHEDINSLINTCIEFHHNASTCNCSNSSAYSCNSFFKLLTLTIMKRSLSLVRLKFKGINLTALNFKLIYSRCLLMSSKRHLKTLLSVVAPLCLQPLRLIENILSHLLARIFEMIQCLPKQLSMMLLLSMINLIYPRFLLEKTLY